MSGQNSEVNRVVDDTAEGHVRRMIEESDEAGKKVAKKLDRRVALDDADAEGHVRALIGETDEAKAANRRVAMKGAVKLEDAETEGHRLVRSQEAEELRARAIRVASIDDADEAEGHVFKK